MGVLNNAHWLMASQAVRVACQLGWMMLMARILSPRDFGLMAMAFVVSAFAMMFRDLGICATIIQKERIDGDDVHTAFATNMAISVAIAISMWVFARPLAQALGNAQAATLIRWLSLSFPATAFGSVHQALLERESRFRIVAVIETIGVLTGLTCGFFLATEGAGASSLAFQVLCTAVISSLMLHLAYGRFSPGRLRTSSLKRLIGFGRNLALFNTINFFSRNADNLIVGRFLGDAALGLYSQAYRIMLLPVQNITYVAGRSLFPVLSRKQSSTDEVWSIYLRSSATIAAVTAPMFLCIALMREEIIEVALGPQWMGCVSLLPWLCACGCLQALTSLTGTMLISKGRTRLHLGIGTFGAIVQVAGFAWGVRGGIEFMTKIYLAANVANSALALGILIPICGGSYRSYARFTFSPFAAATVCMFAGRASVPDMFLAGNHLPRLLLRSLSGIVLYVLVLAFFLPDHARLLKRILPHPFGAAKESR